MLLPGMKEVVDVTINRTSYTVLDWLERYRVPQNSVPADRGTPQEELPNEILYGPTASAAERTYVEVETWKRNKIGAENGIRKGMPK